uniref:Uncharacterized protein n=1 Tax=Arundo donax TaxID=35708 RepID=A0A0A9BXL5_ARUDO
MSKTCNVSHTHALKHATNLSEAITLILKNRTHGHKQSTFYKIQSTNHYKFN